MKLYLIISFITGIISYILIRDTFNEIKDTDTTGKNELLLVIGIVSSQSNFEERQSIRDTWLTLTKQENVKHFFLVGKNFCNIPPEDRIYKEACIEWMIDLKESPSYSTGEINAETIKHSHKKEMYIGFTFLVQHSIVVQRISLLRKFAVENHVQVSLINAVNREKVVSATFASNDNSTGPVVLENIVEQYVLPKGFEGQIITEFIGNRSNQGLQRKFECWLHWSNASGLITFQHLIRDVYEKPVPFHYMSCTYAILTFALHDKEELQSHIIGKADRKMEWENKTKSVQNQLKKESEEKRDILFFDFVDVYRNLPKKVLQFFKWAHINMDFAYLMKTDDDTFVNIPEVLHNLKHSHEVSSHPQHQLRLHWWSSFREAWVVQSFGKWRDDAYRSVTYPPFPCGAGYVLSRDLVQFLGHNGYKFLYQDFQGEDVSLGIWLAGVNPTRYPHDEVSCTWVCDGYCNPLACNKAQLSVKEMYQTWKAYRNCNNMCGCHEN